MTMRPLPAMTVMMKKEDYLKNSLIRRKKHKSRKMNEFPRKRSKTTIRQNPT